jgi:hypothetical protein
MEDAMSNPQQAKLRQTTTGHSLQFLSRVREWWRRRNELKVTLNPVPVLICR